MNRTQKKVAVILLVIIAFCFAITYLNIQKARKQRNIRRIREQTEEFYGKKLLEKGYDPSVKLEDVTPEDYEKGMNERLMGDKKEAPDSDLENGKKPDEETQDEDSE